MSRRDDRTYAERLTLRDAWEDLGWFYGLFSSAVGGPSVLALLQMVFVEHRLVDALQWIVDGYNDITAMLGGWLEPFLAPAISWLNAVFDWRLELYPHWRPLFLLAMMVVAGRARGSFKDTPSEAVIVGIFMALGALLGGLLAGLTPLTGGWWTQGAAAAAPAATTMLLMQIPIALRPSSRHVTASPLDRLREFAEGFGMTAVFAIAAFVVGAGVSFVPGLSTGAGLLTLGGFVLVVGVGILTSSLSADAPSYAGARMGLIVIGGFLTAGMILAADAIIKVLTS